MNYEIKFHVGGGIFSHVMILLENLLQWDRNGDITESDTIYVNSMSNNSTIKFSQIGFNMFDLLLDQETREGDVTHLITTDIHPVYLNEFNEKKDDYRKISKKYLKLNKDIELYINEFTTNNFTENMLGVHVRMTDLNLHHPYLGQVNNNHYINKINAVLGGNEISKIFVASDNFESIKILKKEFGDRIIHNETEFRVDTSNVDSLNTHFKWSHTKKYFIDSFIDAVLLSNCDTTIGRISLFNYGSQSFHWSKIKDYHHIDGETSKIKDPNL
jgi:hypothetical protein|tara:strand:- start:6602 stop:7417 length:816 start_codon:yes stop_codon:yes gene_type:complete